MDLGLKLGVRESGFENKGWSIRVTELGLFSREFGN